MKIADIAFRMTLHSVRSAAQRRGIYAAAAAKSCQVTQDFAAAAERLWILSLREREMSHIGIPRAPNRDRLFREAAAMR